MSERHVPSGGGMVKGPYWHPTRRGAERHRAAFELEYGDGYDARLVRSPLFGWNVELHLTGRDG